MTIGGAGGECRWQSSRERMGLTSKGEESSEAAFFSWKKVVRSRGNMREKG